MSSQQAPVIGGAESTFEQALASRGYRLTGPRRSLARLIARRGGSFTAEEIYAEVRPHGLGRATVYRTLDLMASLGLLERIHLADGCHSYARCPDTHHHHFVCSSCGKVIDLEGCPTDDFLAAASERFGLRVDSHRLEVFGRCAQCLT
ncbi:MAG: transcriptional repressor [Chloroflexi bacterium]|nr:transcriptional repressor [Chloroflexota bacterium]